MPELHNDLGARGAGQLQSAWLDAVELEINPNFDPETVVRYHLSYEHSVTLADDVESVKTGVAAVQLDVNWRDGNDEPLTEGAQPFNLRLRVVGLFTWEREQVDREIFGAWLEWNGVYLLWPYIRSYVAMLTSMSPRPTLTIYTLRVPDPPSQNALEGAKTTTKTTTRTKTAASAATVKRQSTTSKKTGSDRAATRRRST